jgi:hypothetical protein
VAFLLDGVESSLGKRERKPDPIRLDVLKEAAMKLVAKSNCDGAGRVLLYVATKWDNTSTKGQSCIFSVPDATLSTKLTAQLSGYIPIETYSLEDGKKSNGVLWVIFVFASDPSGLTYGDIFNAVDEWNTRHCCSLGSLFFLERVTVDGLEVRVGLGATVDGLEVKSL